LVLVAAKLALRERPQCASPAPIDRGGQHIPLAHA